VREYHSFYNMI